jgi:hypothetical protein
MGRTRKLETASTGSTPGIICGAGLAFARALYSWLEGLAATVRKYCRLRPQGLRSAAKLFFANQRNHGRNGQNADRNTVSPQFSRAVHSDCIPDVRQQLYCCVAVAGECPCYVRVFEARVPMHQTSRHSVFVRLRASHCVCRAFCETLGKPLGYSRKLGRGGGGRTAPGGIPSFSSGGAFSPEGQTTRQRIQKSRCPAGKTSRSPRPHSIDSTKAELKRAQHGQFTDTLYQNTARAC